MISLLAHKRLELEAGSYYEVFYVHIYIFMISLLAHKRLELEAGSYYGVFLRAYVKKDMFISTPWYPIVKTKNTLSKSVFYKLVANLYQCHGMALSSAVDLHPIFSLFAN